MRLLDERSKAQELEDRRQARLQALEEQRREKIQEMEEEERRQAVMRGYEAQLAEINAKIQELEDSPQ